MEMASLVIGIVAAISAFIPCLCWFSIPLAIVGLVLGCIARSKAKKENLPTKKATTGIVINSIVIVLAIIMCIVYIIIGAGVGAALGVFGASLSEM